MREIALFASLSILALASFAHIIDGEKGSLIVMIVSAVLTIALILI